MTNKEEEESGQWFIRYHGKLTNVNDVPLSYIQAASVEQFIWLVNSQIGRKLKNDRGSNFL